jgi:hypothetical protein
MNTANKIIKVFKNLFNNSYLILSLRETNHIVPNLRPLKGCVQTFGYYGTRVRCHKLSPEGLTLAPHGNYNL